MKRATKIVIWLMAITTLNVIGTFIGPLPANDNLPFRGQLAITAALAMMYIGAAILFASSLKAYKEKMRRAMFVLSGGILLTALGTIQLPLASAFGLIDSAWVRGGWIVLPFLFSGLIVFLGIRNFARLISVKTVVTKVSIVLPVVALLSALSVYLPHAVSSSSELETDIYVAILCWTLLLNLASSITLFQIKQHMGAHYTNAMTWLYVALAGSVVIVASALVHALFVGVATDAISITINVFTALLGVIYLRAGYVFTETEDY